MSTDAPATDDEPAPEAHAADAADDYFDATAAHSDRSDRGVASGEGLPTAAVAVASAAVTFDFGVTSRLPNTIDESNQVVW